MAVTFNDKMTPKAKTENFKIYIDVGNDSSKPVYELQGRGVESWTIETNQEIEVTPDVLGYNDFVRGTAQPQQEIELKLRKGSKLGELLTDCFVSGDMSPLDSLSILQKFEMVDGKTASTCLARLQKECAISISSFNGEAGNYLGFTINIYYSNKITMGTMPAVDGDPITFTADGDEAL